MFYTPEVTLSLVATVSTMVNLSSAVSMSFTFTAVAIITSCISPSSVFSETSISDFPISVLRYFPEHHSVDSDIFVNNMLTDVA